MSWWAGIPVTAGASIRSLSTDGDKSAMVNFGGNEKSILEVNEKV